MATPVEQRPIFILTHRRPTRQTTLNYLRRLDTRQPIYLVVDDADPTLDDYRRRYDNVLVFSKSDYAGDTLLPNGGHKGSVVYARRAAYDLAEQIGVTHFVMMDDDYGDFEFLFSRSLSHCRRFTLKRGEGDRLDAIFAAHWRFYDRAPIALLALLQAGDLVGGKRNPLARAPLLARKAMNVFFASVARRVWFRGEMNEDVNTYLWLGASGQLVFSTNLLLVNQKDTQSQPGGATDMYLKLGNYVKSYTSVLVAPAAVKVSPLRTSYGRLHHKINWRHAVPRIVSESWRKP